MAVVTPRIDAEANEYERALTDEQLVALTVAVNERIGRLAAQGVVNPLTMQQIENHHLIGLLECFVGPEDALRVREWHLSWVDHQLDLAEAQIRMQMLETLNGQPG